MPLFNISDLIWDENIYPRSARKQPTIDAYSEALAAGAKFPPIIIQPVVNFPAHNTPLTEILMLILDGIHRWSACKVLGLTEIEAVLWQEQPLDYAACKDDLLLESARRNISHGDRLSQTEKRQVARDIVTRDPECHLSEGMLAQNLGVTQQTVNNWIKDIRARQKASRDSTILRLNRLGWTQQKIADKVGIGRARVSGIVNNTNFCIIDTLIAQGRDMPYIAGHLNMDLATAWATKLTGLKDQEKFKALGWGLRTWDQWYFNDCDDRFGTDWPGRIPAQLVAHTLFYFTDPGDLVMDPMAGGGVVPDVCLLFERKCQAFDLAPIPDRPEIEPFHWTADTTIWPCHREPDLIFFDPPYFTKKQKAYQEKADPRTPPISSLPRQQYMQFFARFFELAHENTRPGAIMAFLNADWRDFESTPAKQESPDRAITLFDFHALLSETGWKLTHRIECPLSSERLSGNQVKNMQEKRILGTVSRNLLIAKHI
jgi:plasmid maintenance system antidote protein VapI